MSSGQLGNYRLITRIGRGSAGTVFVGEYGSLRRPIAIKVLHEHLVADGSADRMIAEARALSLLDHPGIVKVLDCGTTSDGRAYIVMEYLAGELLHQRLLRGPLTEEQVVIFGRQLASALEVAHAAGIIHRDVKPENAFVVVDPEVPGGERIKLLDFGIAKYGDQERTETGIVLGSPAYMAPEQFAASRRVDHRADIYALGIVLYAMATGTLPFAGSNTDELRAEHSFCLPRPATDAGASGRLSEIIDRCLAKQPQDRFGSMTELCAALRELELETRGVTSSNAEGLRALEPRPASLVPPDRDLRTRIPWRPLLAVAAMAVALAYVSLERRNSREEPSRPQPVVEQEAIPSIERPVIEPPTVEPPTVEATVIEAKIEAKTEPPRRQPMRARQKPVRREPIPEPTRESPASTKKEDYAGVAPPTLY
jgi:serine/threonine-protein kinase